MLAHMRRPHGHKTPATCKYEPTGPQQPTLLWSFRGLGFGGLGGLRFNPAAHLAVAVTAVLTLEGFCCTQKTTPHSGSQATKLMEPSMHTAAHAHSRPCTLHSYTVSDDATLQ